MSHGRATDYVNGKCRCELCVAAIRRRRKLLALARLRGEPVMVPVEPVRAHVQWLRSQGMGVNRISEKAGVHARQFVWRNSATQPMTKHCTRRVADAILAVQPDLHPRTLVDSTETWRHIEGLMALGWSRRWLAQRLGQKDRLCLPRGPKVRKSTADRVREIAAEIGDTWGPSKSTRSWAKRLGYHTPAWYDAADHPILPVDIQDWRTELRDLYDDWQHKKGTKAGSAASAALSKRLVALYDRELQAIALPERLSAIAECLGVSLEAVYRRILRGRGVAA